ncbi:MAG: DUF3291 domain-containing protein [Pseudomonadota bacterium]
MRASRHLAQFNIGKLRFPLEDPRNKDFVVGTEIVNRIAMQSRGFVWKFETALGGAVPEMIDEDPMVVVNMTVWESVADLKHFVWNTLHKRFYQRKAEWFSVLAENHSVMWWVRPGHTPDLAEGYARLARLRAKGATAEAFDWDYAAKTSERVDA